MGFVLEDESTMEQVFRKSAFLQSLTKILKIFTLCRNIDINLGKRYDDRKGGGLVENRWFYLGQIVDFLI